MTNPRHLLDIDDLTASELTDVLAIAREYKADAKSGTHHDDLDQWTLGMIFEKPSTRTRVSFETGMTQLGGHGLFLGHEDLQLGRGEPIRDTARALSGYVDAIMARLYDHADAEALAEYATVPVINGLTDEAHPCQTLADLLTIREVAGGFEDVSATWVGDGNNVAQSFALGCALAGVDLTVASPPGYEIDDEIVERVNELGGSVTLTADVEAAVEGTDVIYTDVWISMGQEDEREQRMADFADYQVDTELVEAADDPAIMHCLPANRGEEITNEVMESDNAVIWQQAENRMHAQKGYLVWLARHE